MFYLKCYQILELYNKYEIVNTFLKIRLLLFSSVLYIFFTTNRLCNAYYNIIMKDDKYDYSL